MNNRYLCKAKRREWKELPEDQQWVEGYYCKKKTGRYTDTGFVEEYKDCIIAEFSDGGITWCYIDPSTICQCTGLKDKNGKLIWENDIVKAIYKPKDEDSTIDNFIIKWDKYNCAYVGYYTQKENVYNPLLFGSKTSFEVISNIFDNPELLEGDAE